MQARAALLGWRVSDAVRQALILWLQVHDPGRVTSSVPVPAVAGAPVENAVLAQQVATQTAEQVLAGVKRLTAKGKARAEFRTPRLQALASEDPAAAEHLVVALRLLRQPDKQQVLEAAAASEGSKYPVAPPPALRVLHPLFGSYAAMRDALAAEAGGAAA